MFELVGGASGPTRGALDAGTECGMGTRGVDDEGTAPEVDHAVLLCAAFRLPPELTADRSPGNAELLLLAITDLVGAVRLDSTGGEGSADAVAACSTRSHTLREVW